MENKIHDEKNGLWYEKQGDYYLPCLELPKDENEHIGIWGTATLTLPQAISQGALH